LRRQVLCVNYFLYEVKLNLEESYCDVESCKEGPR